ncbi:MAG: hypothetical protein ACTSRR_00130 [Candidatus Heimdallarchaeaceae archaeon]
MSRNLILLTLLKHAGYIHGRIQFQKYVFLLEHNYHLNTGYSFIPFKYGPYCQALQEDLEDLIEYGYIFHIEEDRGDGEVIHRYQLTEYGEEYLLEHDIPEIYEQVIQDLCYDFKNYSIRQLIEYVYENYPEFIINSEIKTEYYKKYPPLKDFIPASSLQKSNPIINPSFTNWLDEELNLIKKQLNVKDSNDELEFEIDELVLSMFEIAYEDIYSVVEEISFNLIMEDFDESGSINTLLYYILDILESLLNALRENDLITVYTEITNIKTNLLMLKEKVALNKISLKSEITRKLGEFIDDTRYLIDSIDKVSLL